MGESEGKARVKAQERLTREQSSMAGEGIVSLTDEIAGLYGASCRLGWVGWYSRWVGGSNFAGYHRRSIATTVKPIRSAAMTAA